MIFRNKILFLSSLLSIFLLISCKKKVVETFVNGVVNSEIEGLLLSGVEAKFYVKSLSGSSYSNVFELKDTKLTGEDGAYDFSFVKTSSDVEYKIELTKLNYLASTIVLNPSSVNAGSENKRDVNLLPIGTIEFNIKSSPSTSSLDELHFTFNNELESGDSFSNQIFIGSSVDTLMAAVVIAEKHNVFNYVLIRNGQYLFVNDSVFVSKGNSLLKEVVY